MEMPAPTAHGTGALAMETNRPTQREGRKWRTVLIIYLAASLAWAGLGLVGALHPWQDCEASLLTDCCSPWPGYAVAFCVVPHGEDESAFEQPPAVLFFSGVLYALVILTPSLVWLKRRRNAWVLFQALLLLGNFFALFFLTLYELANSPL
jgi:cytochrome bd-type quinol oxidase subunit 2